MDKALRLLAALVLLVAMGHAQILTQILVPAPSGSSTWTTTVISNGISTRGICSGNIQVSITGGNAGDLVVVMVGGAQTSVPVSDGTSSLTALSNSGSGGSQEKLFYLLSSNGANKTYTATLGCGGADLMWAADIATPAGKTWHFDTSNQSSGTGTSLNSGSISTTHSLEAIVFAPFTFYGGGTCGNSSAPTIGGAAASQLTPWSPFSWNAAAGCTSGTVFQYGTYLLTNSAFSGSGAQSNTVSQIWTANIAAFYAQ